MGSPIYAMINRSVEVLANKLSLLRSGARHLTIIIAEGDSDKKLISSFVDMSSCHIQDANGKQRALEVLYILERRGVDGVLAIVDSDHDMLLGRDCPSENAIRTDSHDLEIMLIQSPAFEKVINELGSQEKVASYGEDFRTSLLRSALDIGYLRILSEIDQLSIRFDGLEFSRFVGRNDLRIDLPKLIDILRARSGLNYLDTTRLLARVSALKALDYDPWHVCCGHDVTELLSIALRRLVGSRQAREVMPEVIERSLRLAYELQYFITTRVYQELRLWEGRNPPFKVLR